MSAVLVLYSLLPVTISNFLTLLTLMWELVAFLWMPRQKSGRDRNRFKHIVASGRGRNVFAEFHKSSPKQEYRVHRYGWACLSHLLGKIKPGPVLNVPAGPALGNVNVVTTTENSLCWELRSPLMPLAKVCHCCQSERIFCLLGNGFLCLFSVKW